MWRRFTWSVLREAVVRKESIDQPVIARSPPAVSGGDDEAISLHYRGIASSPVRGTPNDVCSGADSK